MTAVNRGRINWSSNRDEDGHRSYQLTSRVVTTSALDGPAAVMMASGLPAIGSSWSFGSDYDSWAYCWPTMEVVAVQENEPNRSWDVTQTFSTRPLTRCQDQTIDNPLLEPPKISGSFRRGSKLIEVDIYDQPIQSSSHELIVGISKDDSKPTVIIEQNLSTLDLDNMSEYIDTLNDAELWDLPVRCVKLSNIIWNRLMFGLCDFYYTRRLEFDIDKNTFDEVGIIDKGFKKFDTRRAADTGVNRADPDNYVMIRDKNGERIAEPRYLDGTGDPLDDPTTPVLINGGDPVEKYDENNLLLLGIPSVLF